jgi:hypothetical protein
LCLLPAAQDAQIQIWGQNGEAIRRWGNNYPFYEDGLAHFDSLQSPAGICVDPVAGFTFVTDSNAGEVRAYATLTGRLHRTFGHYADDAAEGAPSLFCCSGIACAQGRVFVTEFYTHRVQVFDYEGKWLGAWGGEKHSESIIAKKKRGGGKMPDGEFQGPTGIAVWKNNNNGEEGGSNVAQVLVGDSTGRVQIFDIYGKFKRSIQATEHRIRGLAVVTAPKPAAPSVETHPTPTMKRDRQASRYAAPRRKDADGEHIPEVKKPALSSAPSSAPSASFLFVLDSVCLRILDLSTSECVRVVPLFARAVCVDPETGRIYSVQPATGAIELWEFSFTKDDTQIALAQGNMSTRGLPEDGTALDLETDTVGPLDSFNENSPLSPRKHIRLSVSHSPQLRTSNIFTMRESGSVSRASSVASSPSLSNLSPSIGTATGLDWLSKGWLCSPSHAFGLRAQYGKFGTADPSAEMNEEEPVLKLPSSLLFNAQSGQIGIVDPGSNRVAICSSSGRRTTYVVPKSNRRAATVIAAAWAPLYSLLFLVCVQPLRNQDRDPAVQIQVWSDPSAANGKRANRKFKQKFTVDISTVNPAQRSVSKGARSDRSPPAFACCVVAHPSAEQLFISDYWSNRVLVYRFTGERVCEWTEARGSGADGFRASVMLTRPCSLAIDQSGRKKLYVLLEDGTIVAMDSSTSGSTSGSIKSQQTLQKIKWDGASEAVTEGQTAGSRKVVCSPKSVVFPSLQLVCSPSSSSSSSLLNVLLVLDPQYGLAMLDCRGKELSWVCTVRMRNMVGSPATANDIAFNSQTGTLYTLVTGKKTASVSAWGVDPKVVVGEDASMGSNAIQLPIEAVSLSSSGEFISLPSVTVQEGFRPSTTTSTRLHHHHYASFTSEPDSSLEPEFGSVSISPQNFLKQRLRHTRSESEPSAEDSVSLREKPDSSEAIADVDPSRASPLQQLFARAEPSLSIFSRKKLPSHKPGQQRTKIKHQQSNSAASVQTRSTEEVQQDSHTQPVSSASFGNSPSIHPADASPSPASPVDPSNSLSNNSNNTPSNTQVKPPTPTAKVVDSDAITMPAPMWNRSQAMPGAPMQQPPLYYQNAAPAPQFHMPPSFEAQQQQQQQQQQPNPGYGYPMQPPPQPGFFPPPQFQPPPAAPAHAGAPQFLTPYPAALAPPPAVPTVTVTPGIATSTTVWEGVVTAEQAKLLQGNQRPIQHCCVVQ